MEEGFFAGYRAEALVVFFAFGGGSCLIFFLFVNRFY
jgi:hypothetical protein